MDTIHGAFYVTPSDDPDRHDERWRVAVGWGPGQSEPGAIHEPLRALHAYYEPEA